MDGIDGLGKTKEIQDSLRSNLGTKTRQVWHVDGTKGNDNYSGLSRDDPFATVGAAISAASAGDKILIAEGAYDEAIVIPAALDGLGIICEPRTILTNTATGLVIQVSADGVHLRGGIVNPPGGANGVQVLGYYFVGEDILVNDAAISFDIDGPRTRLLRCISNRHTTTGFDTSMVEAHIEDCIAVGTAATRGFYLSANTADHCSLINCHSLLNTAAGFEAVAGADENMFSKCTQSVLCGGPIDAGANNSWPGFQENSQIVAGQSVQQDLKDIYDEVSGGRYFEQTCMLKMNSTQTLNNTAADKDFIASNATGAVNLISTDDSKVQRVTLIIIGRAVNSYAGNNALDCTTASHNQWRVNLDGGAYSDLSNEEADGQMLDNDWQAIGQGAIHPFTFGFDVTAQVTNIDGKIGVRLENGRSEQASFIVTCDIFLKILWKL
jgi:hypothetical protein